MTRRILALTLVALALAVAGACTDDDEATGPRTSGGGDRPDSGTLVESDGYQGVLLDAHLDYLQPADGPGIEGDAVSSFVPTEDEVATFEGVLPAAFAAAIDPTIHEVTADDLPSYVRQYTGVASGDLQQLVAHGFCDRAVDDDDFGWQDGWIEVNDGGACFWDATLDLATGTIVRFTFNGSA